MNYYLHVTCSQCQQKNLERHEYFFYCAECLEEEQADDFEKFNKFRGSPYVLCRSCIQINAGKLGWSESFPKLGPQCVLERYEVNADTSKQKKFKQWACFSSIIDPKGCPNSLNLPTNGEDGDENQALKEYRHIDRWWCKSSKVFFCFTCCVNQKSQDQTQHDGNYIVFWKINHKIL